MSGSLAGWRKLTEKKTAGYQVAAVRPGLDIPRAMANFWLSFWRPTGMGPFAGRRDTAAKTEHRYRSPPIEETGELSPWVAGFMVRVTSVRRLCWRCLNLFGLSPMRHAVRGNSWRGGAPFVCSALYQCRCLSGPRANCCAGGDAFLTPRRAVSRYMGAAGGAFRQDSSDNLARVRL